MSICVNGSVLSAILFDNTNSDNDKEGFLLGRGVSHVTDAISDSQLNFTKEEIVFYVNDFVSCDGVFNWYDKAGAVEADKIAKLLSGDQKKNVIGWFKSRRHSSASLSLRERAIHQHLKSFFPGVKPQNFVFCLFTGTPAQNLATHNFDFKFLVQPSKTFHALPCATVNLKDTSNSSYKKYANYNLHAGKGAYLGTINAFKSEFCDKKGQLLQVTGVHTMNRMLQGNLTDLCESVLRSENRIKQLTDEVESLKLQIKPQTPCLPKRPERLPITEPPPPKPALNPNAPALIRSNAAKAKISYADKIKATPSQPVDNILDKDIPIMDITEQVTPPLKRKQMPPISRKAEFMEDLQDLFPANPQTKKTAENSSANQSTVDNSVHEMNNSTPTLKPKILNSAKDNVMKPTKTSRSVQIKERSSATQKVQTTTDNLKTSTSKFQASADPFIFVDDMIAKHSTPSARESLEEQSLELQNKTSSLGRNTNRRWGNHNAEHDRKQKTQTVIDSRGVAQNRVRRNSEEY